MPRVKQTAAGRRLTELREAKGLTVEQVADRLDLAKGTIYRFERSGLKYPSRFVKLAKVLGVPIEKLTQP